MKKILLFAAVALASATANAQQLSKGMKMEQNAKFHSIAAPAKAKMSTSAEMKARKKSVASNLWYQLPEGMPAVGWFPNGRGSADIYNVVPPFTDVTLVNKSTNPTATKWFVGDYDMTEDADENGNMTFSLASGYYMPDVTLTNNMGTDSFKWSDLNIYKSYNGSAEFDTFPYTMPLTWCDPHANPTYYGFGYLDSGYIFGTGAVQDGETTWQTYGYMQQFAKPLSPMYVEYMYIHGVCFNSETPIPAGEKVMMYVVNPNTREVIAELSCEPDDIQWMKDDNGNIESTLCQGTNIYRREFFGIFSQKVVDELSGETAIAPFTINSDFEVYIYYSEHSNFGTFGHGNQNATETVLPGYNLVYNVANPDEENGFTCRFDETEYASAPIYFYGMFDYVSVWEEANDDDGAKITDFNVLKVEADGTTVSNVGYPAFNFVQMYTACSWYDEDMNENYYLDVKEGMETPDWLIGWETNDEMWNSESFAPICMLTVGADPLPAGVSGRGCKLYVNGRGYISEEPIYVLQGDYTKEQCDLAEAAAGIDNVVAKPAAKTNAIFNLAGQKIDKNFKGIVIKEGKKFIQK